MQFTEGLLGSVEFLKWFRPGGPWVLTTIAEGRAPTTRTFKPETKQQLLPWLEASDGIENIYFQVNVCVRDHVAKKTDKEDMAAAEWLHVDVDPSAGADLFDAERSNILKKLEGHSPKPSLIIDSGGGYQAFWRLSEPVLPTDNIPNHENWADFESYNRQLAYDLGGDNCHNVDRIMRLPGTTNVPNKKKREKGRTPRPSSVVWASDTTFDLNVFPKAPLVGGGEHADTGRINVELSGNLRPLSVEELNNLPVSDHVKMLIIQGGDPMNPDKYNSRSDVVWRVVCEMVRAEIEDDVIAAVLLDQDLKISNHIYDQKNPQGYTVRQIQRAKEHAIDPWLQTLNSEYFAVIVGGKFRVVRRKNTGVFEYMEVGAFKNIFSNQVVKFKGPNGEDCFKKLGQWWLDHPNRRTYMGGIIFDPSNNHQTDEFNLWQGFAYSPKEGKLHQRYLEHIFENICSSNQEYYDYIIGWVARLIQTPATQSESAIVLRGKEGTGKNSFVGPLGDLFPQHFFEGGQTSQFLGQFNSHLRDKILVHGNEAFFAGDKKHEAALKMLITEPKMPIEAKGIDITQESNYLHVIMSSNSEWVVPAGPESRRFLVLDVADTKRNDTDYFIKMKADLKSGGYENLLHFLMNYDLSKFNVRKIPFTEALSDQRLRTLPNQAKWWMDCLQQGYIVNDTDGWKNQLSTKYVYNSYIEAMRQQGRQFNEMKTAFTRYLKKAAEGIDTKNVYKEGRVYIFPSLEKCRSEFDKNFGGPYEWEEIDEGANREIPF